MKNIWAKIGLVIITCFVFITLIYFAVNSSSETINNNGITTTASIVFNDEKVMNVKVSKWYMLSAGFIHIETVDGEIYRTHISNVLLKLK